jgi:hypothetical protein
VDADRRMSVTVGAFAQLARYLSGIPGRKNLVWLSGSFPLGIYPDTTGQSPFIQGRNYSDELRKAANLLAEAHVAVYPVNVQGLVTDPLFTAGSNDALVPQSMQGSTPTGPARDGIVPLANGGRTYTAVPIAVMQDQNERFALTQNGEHTTMDLLATQTGGQAFYRTNAIAQAIQVASEHGANYYALSYPPPSKKADGSFRKIKVSLRGKKYHLAYRSGYYAVDTTALTRPAKDVTAGLALAAMQQGSPPSRQVVFASRIVPLGKPRVVKDEGAGVSGNKKNVAIGETQRYAVDYLVAPTDLQFTPAEDGKYHDVLNFMITAFDDDGKLLASQVSQVVADLSPKTLQGVLRTGMRLHQEVEIPVKGTVMRLGVEDMANSHIGTVEISLPVKAPPEVAVSQSRRMPPVEPD